MTIPPSGKAGCMEKLVLGIESSCDESAVALLRVQPEGTPEILAEEISSQSNVHVHYGGVVPELASREHLRALPLLTDQVLRTAGVELAEIDVVGVTAGPGLIGCLLVGIHFAEGLTMPHAIPLYGIHHIEGHVFAALLEHPHVAFPYLTLIASGGHTEIHLIEGLGQYRLIARTTDDAAGEAFDKAANLLGLGYPGGARLAALADATPTTPFSLPLPLPRSAHFSFSGLKTAISLLVEEQAKNGEAVRGQIAKSVQAAIVQSLCDKLYRATREHNVRQVVVSGGVSANRLLRSQLKEQLSPLEVIFPSPLHCTDNAAMIALVAALRALQGAKPGNIHAQSRWALESLTPPGVS